MRERSLVDIVPEMTVVKNARRISAVHDSSSRNKNRRPSRFYVDKTRTYDVYMYMYVYGYRGTIRKCVNGRQVAARVRAYARCLRVTMTKSKTVSDLNRCYVGAKTRDFSDERIQETDARHVSGGARERRSAKCAHLPAKRRG